MAWKSAKDALFHPTHSPRHLFSEKKKKIASTAAAPAIPSRILISDRALRVGHWSRAKVVQFWRAAKRRIIRTVMSTDKTAKKAREKRYQLTPLRSM